MVVDIGKVIVVDCWLLVVNGKGIFSGSPKEVLVIWWVEVGICIVVIDCDVCPNGLLGNCFKIHDMPKFIFGFAILEAINGVD